MLFRSMVKIVLKPKLRQKRNLWRHCCLLSWGILCRPPNTFTTAWTWVCNDLGNLGIKLDLVKNKTRGKEMIISREDSRVKIILIPTDEELMIARDTKGIVAKLKK